MLKYLLRLKVQRYLMWNKEKSGPTDQLELKYGLYRKMNVLHFSLIYSLRKRWLRNLALP